MVMSTRSGRDAVTMPVASCVYPASSFRRQRPESPVVAVPGGIWWGSSVVSASNMRLRSVSGIDSAAR